VSPGVGDVEIVLISGAVGVARHVQPEPAPTFSVMRAAEQPLDQLFIGPRRRVIDECVYVLRTGQKSGQVQVGSPDQRITIRPRTGLKAFLVQRFLDEGVYGIRLPPRISYVWNRAPLRFPERPPTPILRRDRFFLVILRRRPGHACELWPSDHALPHGRATDTVNPGFQSRDLLLCQRRQRRHRHPGFIQPGHTAVEQACLAVPWNDCRPFLSPLHPSLRPSASSRACADRARPSEQLRHGTEYTSDSGWIKLLCPATEHSERLSAP